MINDVRQPNQPRSNQPNANGQDTTSLHLAKIPKEYVRGGQMAQMANELTPAEKRRKTIIKKYGSIEAFNAQRYHTPEAKANLLKAQRAGGKASTHRPFKDREYASKMGKRARKLDEANN